MTENQHLDFQKFFSSLSPEPEYLPTVPRKKYDFAVAYPDPSSLPLKELAISLENALSQEGRDLAVYPHVDGYPPLREFVATKLFNDRKIQVSSDQIILGDGSSEAIHMLTEIFIEPRDIVITEQFTYRGSLRTFKRFNADVRGVMCDDDGMLPDMLELTIKQALSQRMRPKLIYTIPTFQNPMGWTMSKERRKAILNISRQYSIPILEDDCYVDLRYDGHDIESIRALDDLDEVLYVGSFSKIIAPGMRLGYLTAPEVVLDKIRAIKSGGGVNQFAALAVHKYATANLVSHIKQINQNMSFKRDAMLAAIGENFGSYADWSNPDGGLYIWMKLSNQVDVVKAHQLALNADVGYHPGPVFSPDSISGRNYLRLCFGYNTVDEIHEGIGRLAEVFNGEGFLAT